LEAGRRAFGVQLYDKAADEYASAGLDDETPLILYNLGQTYRAAKVYEKAIRQYDLFLERGKPGPEVRALVLCHIATMKAELEHAASTAPPTGPAADQAGTTRRDSAPTTTDAARQELRTDSPAEGKKAGRAETSTEHHSAAWYDDHFGVALAGVGVVGLVVGGALLLDARDIDNRASMTVNQQERDQLRDQVRTHTLVGAAIGISGASLLAIGIVKLALHRSTNAMAWNITLSPNGVMAFAHF
jgi:tetratricopeptide (TPR) repeat protein